MHFDDTDVDHNQHPSYPCGETILKMDREHILSIPYDGIIRYKRSQSGCADCSRLKQQVEDHIHNVFREDIQPHVDAFDGAYAADPTADVPELIAALRRAHSEVIVMTWSALTAHGVDDLDKAKWVHEQLAELVIEALNPGETFAEVHVRTLQEIADATGG